jgi:putative MATE family efflux protein
MNDLLHNRVRRTLFDLAVPMLAGTFAMNAYNLTDAWFVSKLGLLPQTAIGFIFPVVMLFNCLAMGLGTGVTSHVSHTLGRGLHTRAAQATTHAIALMVGIAVVVSTLGFLFIDAVFQKLGADARTLPLIHDFMRIWYLGAPFMYLGSMVNGILIAAGDSRAAGRFMMFSTILNLALNPLLIFGYAGFPEMGIRGSATATIISQTITALWMVYWLGKKHRLVATGPKVFAGWSASTRAMLRLGIPSVLSMLLMPISSAVITNLLSGFGNEAVAASGVAARIEMFAFIIPMALGMTLMPFISLNYGAGRLDRVREALTLSTRFALLYGAFIAVVFFLGAPFMASLFSRDARVVETLVSYIRIISFGYGMMETHRYCGFVLTGLQRPTTSMMLNAIRILVLLIPLAILGAHWYGVEGVFVGRLVTDLLAGSIGLYWAYHSCDKLRRVAARSAG